MGKKPESGPLVTKSNKLIEARYKLTLNEQKVIYAIISRIKPTDTEFGVYSFKIVELANLLNLNQKNAYRDLREVTRLLLTRVIQIQDVDGKGETRLIQTNWAKARYYPQKGDVEFVLDKELKPYLLELKGFFTSIKLTELMSFRSQYAGRLYELLCQYQNIGVRKMELEEFKAMLGIDANDYEHFSHIKNRLINPAVTEINAKTNLDVSWEPEKTSRKITALVFKIDEKATIAKKKNKKSSISDEQPLPFDTKQVQKETAAMRDVAILNDMINRFKLPADEALDYIDQFSEHYCVAQVKYIDALKKQPIKLDKYMRDALIKNYAKSKRAKINCPKCNGSGKLCYTVQGDPSIAPIIADCNCLY